MPSAFQNKTLWSQAVESKIQTFILEILNDNTKQKQKKYGYYNQNIYQSNFHKNTEILSRGNVEQKNAFHYFIIIIFLIFKESLDKRYLFNKKFIFVTGFCKKRLLNILSFWGKRFSCFVNQRKSFLCFAENLIFQNKHRRFYDEYEQFQMNHKLKVVYF